MTDNIKKIAEGQYQQELDILQQRDTGPKPAGWALSANAVRDFILGHSKYNISRKFYGDDALVERAIVTLMGHQGLLLIGEPGTAKSLLSELLSAAISGDSQKIIQGTAGTTEDHIKFSWNYALLLTQGPTNKSLIPSAIFKAMQSGTIARFEEITRCPQEIQDAMISIMSEKQIVIPELGQTEFAKPGFNIIATANIKDKGVNEMSSALKRRFNFETVQPIKDTELEKKLIYTQVMKKLQAQSLDIKVNDDLLDVLVTTFDELRGEKTAATKALDAVLSTAEAVEIAYACSLQSYYMGTAVNTGQIAQQMQGVIIKDTIDNKKKLAHYLDVIVKERSTRIIKWQDFYQMGKSLWMN